MRVNDIDISAFSAELLNRQLSTQKVDTLTAWFPGSNTGTLLNQLEDFKLIYLTFLIKENDEDAAYKQISKLTEELRKCQIKFNDINLIFSCALNGNVTPERVQNGVFKVTYNLKNDWGKGDPVTAEYELTTSIGVRYIPINYYDDWTETVGPYKDCFDEDEIKVKLTTEKIYIDTELAVAAAAMEGRVATSWEELFLNMGVDINKYRPSDNYSYGLCEITEPYNTTNIVPVLSQLQELNVSYKRFSADEEYDLPDNMFYPSEVFTVDSENTYYFDLGVGEGIKPCDLSIIVYGRYSQAVSGATSGSVGNGPMFSAGPEYEMSLRMPYMDVRYGSTIERTYQVFDTKGSNIITFENIASLPLRQYGFKSNYDGAYDTNLIFNGVTYDSAPGYSTPLTHNVFVLRGGTTEDKFARYCEISRVQIYNKDELIRDCVPVNGNIKNGFYNKYDSGLYDVITMEFIPWKSVNDEQGPMPNSFMSLPGSGLPDPVGGLPGEDPLLTILDYDDSIIEAVRVPEGNTYVLSAQQKSSYDGQRYEFVKWDKGSSTDPDVTSFITDPTSNITTITMPGYDVTVKAYYQLDEHGELPTEDGELLIYKALSDINNETVMGEGKNNWADIPRAYGTFYVVWSEPGVVPSQWSIVKASNYKNGATGTDKWGRSYATWKVAIGKSASGQKITITWKDGSTYAKDFSIKSI